MGYMERNIHIISILLTSLAVLGICSCTKGGIRDLDVNVNSINIEGDGGEVSIDAGNYRIDAVGLWSWDKTFEECSITFGHIVHERYYDTYGSKIYHDFITPETLVIEANDWLTIIVPPFSLARGVSKFTIKVKENRSGLIRDRWLELWDDGAAQAWIPLKQSCL